jgi:hypothetical protein
MEVGEQESPAGKPDALDWSIAQLKHRAEAGCHYTARNVVSALWIVATRHSATHVLNVEFEAGEVLSFDVARMIVATLLVFPPIYCP